MNLKVGDQVVWQRINYDRRDLAYPNDKVYLLEPFEAVLLEITEKRFLLQFEKNGVKKWIVRKNAIVERINNTK